MGPFNLTIFLGLDFFPVNAVKVMTTQLVFIYKVVIIDFVFVGVWRGVLRKGRVTCDIIIIQLWVLALPGLQSCNSRRKQDTSRL